MHPGPGISRRQGHVRIDATDANTETKIALTIIALTPFMKETLSNNIH
jgi:hypothetical protein